ncbi:MAG: hypothetical protein J0647_06095 [Campylobacteraceae bacterium]|nr:hypothetical protein [Campylobacteraceae bacterium]
MKDKIMSYLNTPKIMLWLSVSIFVLGFLHTFYYKFYQPDDAFIYLVYVQSYLNGFGLTFNGELVEGYSSVLWTLLVTAVSILGLDPMDVSKALGWIFYILLGLFLFVLFKKIANEKKYLSLLMIMLYFSVPPLAMWASGAMETMLFAFLVSFAPLVYAYGRIYNPSYFNSLISGIAFGLISLTRPEGFALIGSIFAFELVYSFYKKELNKNYFFIAFVSYLFITLVMFLGRCSVYHELFPVTVSAKTGNLAWQMQLGTAYILSFIKEYPLFFLSYFFSLVIVILNAKKDLRLFFMALMGTIVIMGYGLFNFLVGGDWMLGWRFLVPILPLMVFSILVSVYFMKTKIMLIAVLVNILMFASLTLTLNELCFNERKATFGDDLMGQYIKSLNLPKNTVLAVVDAGAIPYYAALPTIDMIGLNNRHIAKLPGGFLQKYDNEYVLSQKPQVIQFHTKYINDQEDVAPTKAFRGGLVLFYTPEFQKWYDRDKNSPVPHLFVRRDVPLEKTFLDTYYDASLRLINKQKGEITVELTKIGEGTWLNQESTHLEAGVVYLKAKAINNAGSILHESLHTIPSKMLQNDKQTITIKLPELKDNIKWTICPTLLGVKDFNMCSEGEAIEFGNASSSKPFKLNELVSFKDTRLFLQGWSEPEMTHIWSLGTKSSIEFTVNEKPKSLALLIQPFEVQNIKIYLNEQLVLTKKIDKEELVIVNGNLTSGKNTIVIEHPDAKIPSQNDLRKIAIAFKEMRID